MESLKFAINYLEESISVKSTLLKNSGCMESTALVADGLVEIYRKGGKLLIAGNGGSAGDAQHIAAEFVSRFLFDRPGLPAIALTTDTSMLTAIGNDYGFEKLFSRQVEAQGQKGDMFIGISTSGNSKNVIKAVQAAKSKGIYTVALCGLGGTLASLADIAIQVPCESTPYIQECHISIGHIICALVEQRMFG